MVVVMNETEVTINFQLQVLPDNSIIVPGCEPSSSLSSATLSYSLMLNGCHTPKVPVNLILDRIPGTYVKYGWDFNLGYNQTWLVFPPYGSSCPCEIKPDLYNMLRCLAKEIPEKEDPKPECAINEREFCNPDIKAGGGGPTSKDVYTDPAEGPTALGYGGLLPPIPPWARKSVDVCKLAGMQLIGDKPQEALKINNVLESILR